VSIALKGVISKGGTVDTLWTVPKLPLLVVSFSAVNPQQRRSVVHRLVLDNGYMGGTYSSD
jgi:hypothetical protein